MPLATPLTLERALNVRANVWPVRATSWGNLANLVALGPSVNTLGPYNISPQGIAINPDSVIDRVMVEFTPGGIGGLQPANATFTPGAQNRIVVTKDQPYLQPLPGPITLLCPEGDFFDTTFADITGTNQNFPTSGGTPANAFIDVVLAVDIILRDTARYLPVRRTQYGSIGFTRTSGVGGTPSLINVIPVSGRRKVRVSISCPTGTAGLASWRVGGLIGYKQYPTGLVNYVKEIPLTAGAAVAAAAVGTLQVATDPQVRFITVWAESAGAADTVLNWIEADD